MILLKHKVANSMIVRLCLASRNNTSQQCPVLAIIKDTKHELLHIEMKSLHYKFFSLEKQYKKFINRLLDPKTLKPILRHKQLVSDN